MRKHRLLPVAAIILTTCISACITPRTVYVRAPLDRPPRPVLPTVSEAELQCLGDDVYARLVQRDIARRHYCEALETIIESTHEK